MRNELPGTFSQSLIPTSASLFTASQRGSLYILAFPQQSICHYLLLIASLTWYWGTGREWFLLFWFSHRQLLCWGLLGIPDPSSHRARKWSSPRPFSCLFSPPQIFFWFPLPAFVSYGFCSVRKKGSDGTSGFSLEQLLLSSPEPAPQVSHAAPILSPHYQRRSLEKNLWVGSKSSGSVALMGSNLSW